MALKQDLEKYLGAVHSFEREELPGAIALSPWLSDEMKDELDISITEIVFLETTPYHYHETMKEIFRFHDKGKIVLDGEEFEVYKDNILYVPENMKHKIIPYGGILRATLINVPRFDPSDEYVVE